MRALLSVSDKTGITEFGQKLVDNGYELFSTGGTLKALQDANVAVKSVSELTNFPEIMDGRVKTLHPAVHGGLLADRSKQSHLDELKEQDIDLIDMVVVNLYPFEETVKDENVRIEDAIENIDIGGPTMLRAAAKNYKHVLSIVNPADYDEVISRIQTDDLTEDFRRELMVKVFKHTTNYDQAITNFFSQAEKTLRYGENPHQNARYIRTTSASNTILNAKILNGKELSYNNFRDADSAYLLARKFSGPVAVAVKHMNPCGVGVGDSIHDAFMNAYEADSQSIFGGIVALNKEVDLETAEALSKIFLEVIIAPKYTAAALEKLQEKKNLRVLEIDFTEQTGDEEIVSVSGGYLIQDRDNTPLNMDDVTVVTKKEPTESEYRALALALEVVKHVKSNAIVLADEHRTVGIGAGQMNRVGALKIAIERATKELDGTVVMASDGFFPMPDSVQVAHEAGIHAIIQPGGSKRDQESIDYCDAHDMTMVTTGMRHFKH
ncbi:MAG TPA: bifunctional phosphoribosylaminoimidazolecarboxamide formyltransferase/IMP cyclohydrolase [Candidatus Nosocomiicoccus stercorigallinarum]|nr:bifunctional phosphoribosylaminoimidazolecarboxamide formyltransferase/IMP cyclohydrolase [Candidatus Nosocomiicoccus stercorigallinarum]